MGLYLLGRFVTGYAAGCLLWLWRWSVLETHISSGSLYFTPTSFDVARFEIWLWWCIWSFRGWALPSFSVNSRCVSGGFEVESSFKPDYQEWPVWMTHAQDEESSTLSRIIVISIQLWAVGWLIFDLNWDGIVSEFLQIACRNAPPSKLLKFVEQLRFAAFRKFWPKTNKFCQNCGTHQIWGRESHGTCSWNCTSVHLFFIITPAMG